MLLALDDLVWRIDWARPPWSSMPMSTILRWTPDEAQHCTPIAKMTAEAVCRVFGMSPLWVSCWACFSGSLTDDDVKVLEGVPERQFLHAVE